MSFNKIPEEKLFSNHSKEEISNWCKNLNYFHYMRARAGHNCEGDSFAVNFKYDGKEDLIDKMSQIGIILKPLEKDLIPFDPFASYDIDDLDKIRYTIPGIDDIEQPQETSIFGYKVYIWVQPKSFEISISGTETDNVYEVSDSDFKVCSMLEKEFDKLSWSNFLDEKITSHPHCISKENYPELYL